MERDVTLSIHLTEDSKETEATAVLDLRGEHFEARGRARRNPLDPNLPVVGEELAIARAMSALESELMDRAHDKINQFLGRW